MTWGPDELGEVAGNRDHVFPPLQDEHDPGDIQTRFMVTVPFKVNGARFQVLVESLKRWAEDQDLLDFIRPEQVTYEVRHEALTIEFEDEEDEEGS